MDELLLEQISEFRGAYPDIPLTDVDMSALEGAFFVTLPVGRVGAKSRNGRTYTKAAVESIVEQINRKRPEGRWGHLTQAERATRYDPPAIRWLAATLDAEGVAWAKGIPMTAEAKEHFRVAKAAHALVGTSIYGTADLRGEDVMSLDLETIDLAGAARVGVPETAARPQITQETVEVDDMAEDNATLISELTTERDTFKTQLQEMQGKYDATIAELDSARAELTEAKKVQLASDVRAVIAELVELEALRPIVSEMLGDVDSKEAAEKRIAELLEREDVQRIAKALVAELAGPRAVVAPKPADNKPLVIDEAYIAEARRVTAI